MGNVKWIEISALADTKDTIFIPLNELKRIYAATHEPNWIIELVGYEKPMKTKIEITQDIIAELDKYIFEL